MISGPARWQVQVQEPEDSGASLNEDKDDDAYLEFPQRALIKVQSSLLIRQYFSVIFPKVCNHTWWNRANRANRDGNHRGCICFVNCDLTR